MNLSIFKSAVLRQFIAILKRGCVHLIQIRFPFKNALISEIKGKDASNNLVVVKGRKINAMESILAWAASLLAAGGCADKDAGGPGFK